MKTTPLRIGILGCGGVAEYAMIAPAQDEPGIEVVAVASRDVARAQTYATRHGIARFHGSYESLLHDPHVDAVYVALPNSLHHDWTIAALEASRPVLCEKPLASNALQANAMAVRADALGLTLLEGFHWRHHPVTQRMMDVVTSGALGEIQSIDTFFHIPLSYVDATNIRLNLALAGGSTMDQGCYCINLLRFVSGREPTVLSAKAALVAEGIDGAMTAKFDFGDGMVASMACSMNGTGSAIECGARITGSRDSLIVDMPFLPHLGSSLCWGGQREEMTLMPSYVFQARRFAAAVAARKTGLARDGVDNMAVVDAVYVAAGLARRG